MSDYKELLTEKIKAMRTDMENELELLYNQAQRRGASRPAPSQIVDCVHVIAATYLADVMEQARLGARTRKSQ
jgi:hypothetical protein